MKSSLFQRLFALFVVSWLVANASAQDKVEASQIEGSLPSQFRTWPRPNDLAIYDKRTGRILSKPAGQNELEQFRVEAIATTDKFAPVSSTSLKEPFEYFTVITYGNRPAIAIGFKEGGISFVDSESGKEVYRHETKKGLMTGLWAPTRVSNPVLHYRQLVDGRQFEFCTIDLVRLNSRIRNVEILPKSQFRSDGLQFFMPNDDSLDSGLAIDHSAEFRLRRGPRSSSRNREEETPVHSLDSGMRDTIYAMERIWYFSALNEQDDRFSIASKYYSTNSLEMLERLPFIPVAFSQTHRIGVAIKVVAKDTLRFVAFDTLRHQILGECAFPNECFTNVREQKVGSSYIDDDRKLFLYMDSIGVCTIDLQTIFARRETVRETSLPRHLNVGQKVEIPVGKTEIQSVPTNAIIQDGKLVWTPSTDNVGRNEFHLRHVRDDNDVATMSLVNVSMPSLSVPANVMHWFKVPGKRELIAVCQSHQPEEPPACHLISLDEMQIKKQVSLKAGSFRVNWTPKGLLFRYENGQLVLLSTDDLSSLKTGVLDRQDGNRSFQGVENEEPAIRLALETLKVVKENTTNPELVGRAVHDGFLFDDVLWADKGLRRLLLPSNDRFRTSLHSEFGPYARMEGYFFEHIPSMTKGVQPLNVVGNGCPWIVSVQNNNSRLELVAKDFSNGKCLATIPFCEAGPLESNHYVVLYVDDCFGVIHLGQLFIIPIPKSLKRPFRIEPAQSHLAVHPKSPTRVRYYAEGAIRYELEILNTNMYSVSTQTSTNGVFVIDPSPITNPLVEAERQRMKQESSSPVDKDAKRAQREADQKRYMAQTGQVSKGPIGEFFVRVRAYDSEGGIAQLSHRYMFDLAGKEIRNSFRFGNASADEKDPTDEAVEPNETLATPENNPSEAKIRKWTNKNGKAVEAEFVGLEDKVVLLKIKERSFRVPLDQLSDEDQAWITKNHKP